MRAENDLQYKHRIEKLELQQQREAQIRLLMFEQFGHLQLTGTNETQPQYQQPHTSPMPIAPAGVQRHTQVSSLDHANTSSQAPLARYTYSNCIETGGATDATDSEGVPGSTNIHFVLDHERTHLELCVPSASRQMCVQHEKSSPCAGDNNTGSHGEVLGSVSDATRALQLFSQPPTPTRSSESNIQQTAGGLASQAESSCGMESEHVGSHTDRSRRQPMATSSSGAHGVGQDVTTRPQIPGEEPTGEHSRNAGLVLPFHSMTGCHSSQATHSYTPGHGEADSSSSSDPERRQMKSNYSSMANSSFPDSSTGSNDRPNRQRSMAIMFPDPHHPHHSTHHDNRSSGKSGDASRSRSPVPPTLLTIGPEMVSDASVSSSSPHSAPVYEHGNTESREQTDENSQSTHTSDESPAHCRSAYFTADDSPLSDSQSHAVSSQMQSSMPSPPSMTDYSLTTSGYRDDGQVARGKLT